MDVRCETDLRAMALLDRRQRRSNASQTLILPRHSSQITLLQHVFDLYVPIFIDDFHV